MVSEKPETVRQALARTKPIYIFQKITPLVATSQAVKRASDGYYLLAFARSIDQLLQNLENEPTVQNNFRAYQRIIWFVLVVDWFAREEVKVIVKPKLMDLAHLLCSLPEVGGNAFDLHLPLGETFERMYLRVSTIIGYFRLLIEREEEPTL